MKNLNKHKLFLFKISAFVGVIVIFILIEILLRLLTPSFTEDNLIDIGNLSFFTPVSVRGEKYIKITNKLAYSEQNSMFRERKKVIPNVFFALEEVHVPDGLIHRMSVLVLTCNYFLRKRSHNKKLKL